MTAEKYLTVQRTMLRADSATEFRSVLNRIRKEAGLSCGQISVKANIPRSQAYALVDPKRTGLPSKPDQVIAFLRACNLSPMHTDIVMDRLRELKQHQAPNTSVLESSVAISHHDPVSSSPLEPLPAATTPPRSEITNDDIVLRMGKLASTRRTSNTTLTHLAHYVLASDERTRRASRLMLSLGFALFLVLVALGGVLILVPDAIRAWVVGGVGGSIALCIIFAMRALARNYH
ncbi:hypothetical protein ABZ345_44680 [Lentzea sp. NPDC005914]|uniref:hypothetical protein n=1 Tax=Lentzea sp. NPDC005914 TaxID=3154572 RepID=UPI0033D010AD